MIEKKLSGGGVHLSIGHDGNRRGFFAHAESSGRRVFPRTALDGHSDRLDFADGVGTWQSATSCLEER